jgi:hypothetical protein
MMFLALIKTLPLMLRPGIFRVDTIEANTVEE